MDDYIAPAWRDRLAGNNLGSFESIWAIDTAWFEEPNHRRGGWSGVVRLQLADSQNAKRTVFIKRQENHTRLSWRHPIKGEPTFEAEMRNIMTLDSAGVAALVPVYYAQRKVAGKWRAILITEALEGFRPMDAWLETWRAQGWVDCRVQRRAVIRATAELVGRLHRQRLVHNALYPKHLFVRIDGDDRAEVRLIDLEKMRRVRTRAKAMYRDLDTLNRRTAHVSRTDRLRFLLSYLGVDHVTPAVRCHWDSFVPRYTGRRRRRCGN